MKHLYSAKLRQHPLYVLEVKKGESRDGPGRDPNWPTLGGYAMVENMPVYRNSLPRKPIIMCCDRTACRSLFHSVGETIAKSNLPMAFLGQTVERDGLRLLVLIKDDKYVGWENLMALKVIILYLNKMQYEMGSQCIVFEGRE